MTMDKFKENYRAIRHNMPSRPARMVLGDALILAAQGKTAYPDTREASPIANAAFPIGSDTAHFCENPEYHGMRDCGDATGRKAILSGRPHDHTGWYMDNGGEGELALGCVYRYSRFYVPAIRDPNNKNAAILIWSDRTLTREGEDALRQAASNADSAAQSYAESEREYQAAWHAGNDWESKREESADVRKSIRKLIAELRRATEWTGLATELPEICATLRASLKGRLQTLQQLRDERAKLADGEYISDYVPGFSLHDARLCSAFNEGAGKEVLKVKVRK
jgi:hypothetical protein